MKDGYFLALYSYKGIYMSNISHSANQKSCNFYTRTKFGIGFFFLHECISATKLSLLTFAKYSF